MRAIRIKDYGRRDAVLLEGEKLRVVVTDKGGMVPELSFPSGNGWFNTHWIPHFRGNTGEAFDLEIHGDVWPVELLYELAGNFLCLPNFGGGCEAYGVEFAPHAITASAPWRADAWGELTGKAVYQRTVIAPSESYPSLPLETTRYDVVFDDQPAHYVYLKVKNTGDRSYRFTLGWHNTIGPPFLSPGCRIDLSADRFSIPPSPSEFDPTTRLEIGGSFDDLGRAPLSDGRTVDLHVVPGMIGYTDFVTGAVPEHADLGWSAVVNPHVHALYASIFPSPRHAREDEIPVHFNDLWMQYGGRPMAPWSSHEGGTDYTYCLGAENATGAYANGLAYSLEHEELLGRPTTVAIGPGEELGHVYATLACPYDEGVLDRGVSRIEPTSGGIDVVPASGGAVRLDVDAEFDSLRELVEAMEEAR